MSEVDKIKKNVLSRLENEKKRDPAGFKRKAKDISVDSKRRPKKKKK